MLDELDERYREQGLCILTLNVGEDVATVKDFLREHPVSFRAGTDLFLAPSFSKCIPPSRIGVVDRLTVNGM